MDEIRQSNCAGLKKILSDMITDERTLQILEGNGFIHILDIDIYIYIRTIAVLRRFISTLTFDVAFNIKMIFARTI